VSLSGGADAEEVTSAGWGPEGALSGGLAALFGEGSGGFLVSGPGPVVRELLGPDRAWIIGEVGGSALRIEAGEERIEVDLAELARAHGALAELFP
jgi:hypothetical protein